MYTSEVSNAFGFGTAPSPVIILYVSPCFVHSIVIIYQGHLRKQEKIENKEYQGNEEWAMLRTWLMSLLYFIIDL